MVTEEAVVANAPAQDSRTSHSVSQRKLRAMRMVLWMSHRSNQPLAAALEVRGGDSSMEGTRWDSLDYSPINNNSHSGIFHSKLVKVCRSSPLLATASRRREGVEMLSPMARAQCTRRRMHRRHRLNCNSSHRDRDRPKRRRSRRLRPSTPIHRVPCTARVACRLAGRAERESRRSSRWDRLARLVVVLEVPRLPLCSIKPCKHKLQ